MVLDASLAIVHHFCALGLIAVLAMEWTLLRGAPSADSVKRILRIDGLYGLAAVVLLLVGYGRLAYAAKGFAFYKTNPVFWIKMTLFAVIGLISILPTIRYFQWNKALRDTATLPDATTWASTRRLVVAQAMLFPFVLACAALMARGIGL